MKFAALSLCVAAAVIGLVQLALRIKASCRTRRGGSTRRTGRGEHSSYHYAQWRSKRYSIITFEGAKYSIRFNAARRPADHQMSIYAPDEITVAEAPATEVLVNVFGGSTRSIVEIRLGTHGPWVPTKRVEREDPYFADLKKREAKRDRVERKFPAITKSKHLWVALLPAGPSIGSHLLRIRTTDMIGQMFEDNRIIAIRGE